MCVTHAVKLLKRANFYAQPCEFFFCK